MTTKCDKCQTELIVGMWPFCPHPMGSGMIATDEIPGGLEVKHGICWPDGTPRKFYSKSEIKKTAYESGWTIHGDTPKPNPRLQDARAERAESRKA